MARHCSSCRALPLCHSLSLVFTLSQLRGATSCAHWMPEGFSARPRGARPSWAAGSSMQLKLVHGAVHPMRTAAAVILGANRTYRQVRWH